MSAFLKAAFLVATVALSLPGASPAEPLDLTRYNLKCEKKDDLEGWVKHWEKKGMLNKESAEKERAAHDASCPYDPHRTTMETEVIEEPPIPGE